MRCLRFRGGPAHEGSPLVSNWLCHCCESVHLVNLCSQLCVYCVLCADLDRPSHVATGRLERTIASE